MSRNIDRDVRRFRDILRGKVRRNLKKYITGSEMLGRRGREVVSIPVPGIDIPHFRHGDKGNGGVGQGEGEPGQPLGPGQPGSPTGEAGSDPGQHIREVEVSLDELADMLADELQLPNIKPKGSNEISSSKDRYNSVRNVGPKSLRHFKRTYKQSLRRQITSGAYDPQRPVIIPRREDERFRSWTTEMQPQANAAIIYMMDVSGSMTDEQKEVVRTESFWIDTWLKRQYEGVERRYIVHDAVAHEVDEDTFFRTRESGGTRISSAYKAAAHIIARDFPPDDWNLYLFHFSDGDNWGDDNTRCLEFLSEALIPICNLFCYGQVRSPYGSGDFIRQLEPMTATYENLILSEINDRDEIYDSIKTFLGTGR